MKREVKSKGEKERYTHLNAEFQRIARRDKKGFLSDQCKEIEENNRMGKTRDLFKKIGDTKVNFHAKMPAPQKNKCKKAKWLSEEALQIAVKTSEVTSTGEKER